MLLINLSPRLPIKMKAYSDLANELGKMKASAERKHYTSKIKGSTKTSPGRSHYVTDYTGRSCLATRKLPNAVSNGSYEEICQLVHQGANPQIADSKGRTPLHFAACRGEASIVQLLISNGAAVNEQDNVGNTPLHLACTAGHVGIVTVLLKEGTDLMATDRRGCTPLHVAFSRLNVLKMSSKTPFIKRKEIESIIEMVKEYISVAKTVIDKEDDEEIQLTNKKDEVSELEQLAGKLSLSETPEQIDEVQDLLCSFTQLSLQKRDITTS